MADIKQAALWMKEGKGVRRPQINGFLSGVWDESAEFMDSITQVIDAAEYPYDFSLDDLLANDWELVEASNAER